MGLQVGLRHSRRRRGWLRLSGLGRPWQALGTPLLFGQPLLLELGTGYRQKLFGGAGSAAAALSDPSCGCRANGAGWTTRQSDVAGRGETGREAVLRFMQEGRGGKGCDRFSLVFLFKAAMFSADGAHQRGRGWLWQGLKGLLLLLLSFVL